MKKKEQEREPDLAQGGQEGEKAKRKHGRLYYITVAACALVLIAAIVLMAVFLSPAATSETLEEPVTRADAAQMLSAAGTLLRGEEEEGLFGWL